jgi:hypothetical protein
MKKNSARLRNRAAKRAAEVKDEDLVQERHLERLAIASHLTAKEERIGGDPKQLAANLRALCRQSGKKQKDIANSIGSTSQWLRSRCKYGVGKVTPHNRRRLEKLANLFGVQPVDLWSADCLSRRCVSTQPQSNYINEIYHCQQLLDSGCYPWLAHLLRILHDSWILDGAKYVRLSKANPKDNYLQRQVALMFATASGESDTDDTSE